MEAVCRWVLCSLLLGLNVFSVGGQWCAPKLLETNKWTLKITHTDQGPDVTESTSTLSRDVTGQRLASHEVGTHNGKDYSVFYLYYNPAGTLYTVVNWVCTSSPVSGNVTDLCFNWNGDHVIDYFTKEFIDNGENRLFIQGSIAYNNGIGSLYSMTMEGFIPLFVGTEGVIDGVPTYTVSSYLNVTQGIRDPSVFTPPENCIKSESTSTLSIDVIGQRLASHEVGTRNGKDYSVFYLYYYPAGTLFTIVNGVCTLSPLSGNVTQSCYSWDGDHVIDYLTKEYIGDSEDGSPIMGSITYNNGIGALYSFDIEGSIPLFVGRDGVIDGVPTYTVSSYLNVTFGIRDPNVFTPPESCVQAEKVSASPSQLYSVLDL